MKPKELRTSSETTIFKKNARAAPLQRRKKKNAVSSQIQAFQSVQLWSSSSAQSKEPPSKLIFEFFKNNKIQKEEASTNINLVLNLIENEGNVNAKISSTARELLVNCNEDPYLASNNPELMPTMKKPNINTAKKPEKILTETNNNYTKMLNDLVQY